MEAGGQVELSDSKATAMEFIFRVLPRRRSPRPSSEIAGGKFAGWKPEETYLCGRGMYSRM